MTQSVEEQIAEIASQVKLTKKAFLKHKKQQSKCELISLEIEQELVEDLHKVAQFLSKKYQIEISIGELASVIVSESVAIALKSKG